MKLDWVIIAVVISAIVLIVALIVKNMKDKNDVTKFFNADKKVDKDPELKDEE